MLRAILAVFLLGWLIAPATASAGGPTCPEQWAVGVGGVGDGGANNYPFRAVDHRVQYSGWLNAMEEGIAALTEDVNGFRANCPSTDIVLSGHSQGAAIVHVYVTRNQDWLPGVATAVLYSDPKQQGTGESDHLFRAGGYPIAGTDANFGAVPVVSICNHDDVICNHEAGWWGYAFGGAHNRYDFQPRWHAGKMGVIWG